MSDIIQREEQNMRHKISVAIIVLTLLASGFISTISNVQADGNGTYPAPGTGHWVIANETYVGNETITLNGNLTILNGGSLTLRNVTLIMNCTFDGEYQIEVQRGGSLFIYDNDNDMNTTGDTTNITAYNANNGFEIRVRAGSNFTMKNSELHECGKNILPQSGLIIETNGTSIENSEISYCKTGVYYLNSSNNTINNCNISFNTDGVSLGSSSNKNSVSYSEFFSNDIIGIGIYSSNNSITNNRIISSGNDGVAVSAKYNIIKDCEFSDFLVAISVDSDSNSIVNCNITGGTLGIAVNYASYTNITGCVISGTYSNIELLGADYNNVSNCDLTSSVLDSIQFSENTGYGSDGNIIYNCNISGSIHGVDMRKASGNSFIKCDITMNSQYGVYIHNKSNNNIFNECNISSNTGDGVYVYYLSNGNIFDDCEISYNGGNGIKLFTVTNFNIIRNCNITSNTLDGVSLVWFADGNKIIGCNISSNNRYGIYFYYATNTEITNSTIKGSPIYDLYISLSSDVTTLNSTFIRSKARVFDANSELNVKWFLHVYVNDSADNPVSDAIVEVQDNANGTFDESYSSSLDGWVRWIVLTEYYQNKTILTEYTPHHVNAYNITNSGIADVTMSESKSIVITMFIDITPPTTNISIGEPKYRLIPTDDWNVTSDTGFTLTATDPFSGVDETWYIIDGDYYTGTTFNLSEYSDGQHTIEWGSIDNAGNNETANTMDIYLDDSPPIISINYPIANNGYENTIWLNNTIVDISGHGNISTYRYRIDSGGFQALIHDVGNYWNASIDTTMLVDGIHMISVYSNDTLNNSNYISINIRIDNNPPTAVAGPDQQVYQGTNFQFDGSGSTDTVGIMNYTWNFTDGVPLIRYGVNPTYILNNIGNYMVTLNVTDMNGHWDIDTMWVNVSDGDAPSSNAGSGWQGWFSSVPMNIPYSATDNIELKNITLFYRYCIDNTSWGGWTPSQTILIGGTTANGDFSFTCPYGEGYYQFYTIAFDNATNSEIAPGSMDSSIGYDSSLPIADAGADQQVPQGTNVQFDGSGSTDIVGIVNYTWSFNDGIPVIRYDVNPTFIFNIIGNYMVTLNVTDEIGYWDIDTMWVNVSDGEVPSSNAGSGWQGWFTAASMNIPYSATDNYELKNITLFYRYSTDNTSWGGWTLAQTLLISGTTANGDFSFSFPDGDGYYQFYTIAFDNANNGEIAPSSQDSDLGYDSTSPVIVSIISEPIPPLNDGLTTFTITFNEDMDQSIQPIVTFGLSTPYDTHTIIGDWTSSTTWVGTFEITTSTGDGTHILNVHNVEDMVGNAMNLDTSFTFVIDTTSPTSDISPLPVYETSLSFPITYTLDDGAGCGVKNITLFYRKDGGSWIKYGTEEPADGTFSFTSTSDGLYEFYTLAIDHAGNSEVYTTINAYTTVDTASPILISYSPTGTNVSLEDNITITFNEEMNITSFADAFLLTNRIDNWTIMNGSVTWSNLNKTMLFVPNPGFEYNMIYMVSISVLAMDMAGNSLGDFNWEFTTKKIYILPTEEIDTDGDGIPDDQDDFPDDPNEDTDTDGDGIGDNSDEFPDDANETIDTDGDGVGNNADTDDDGDGYLDEWEVNLGTDPLSSSDFPLDTDNDGIPDGNANNTELWMDTDDDGDYVLDEVDADPLDPETTDIIDDTSEDEIGSNYIWIVIILILAILGTLLILKRKLVRVPIKEVIPPIEETVELETEHQPNNEMLEKN